MEIHLLVIMLNLTVFILSSSQLATRHLSPLDVIITHFFSPEDSTFYLGQVKIGNNVFLGMNTLIISPVTIGDNAVLAAGSVVTRDIPSGEIWGGVPAKFIKKRITKHNN